MSERYDVDGCEVVDGGATLTCYTDALNIVTGDGKPKAKTVREVRIDFRIDGTSTLKVETFMTFKELYKLVRMLMEVGA